MRILVKVLAKIADHTGHPPKQHGRLIGAPSLVNRQEKQPPACALITKVPGGPMLVRSYGSSNIGFEGTWPLLADSLATGCSLESYEEKLSPQRSRKDDL